MSTDTNAYLESVMSDIYLHCEHSSRHTWKDMEAG